MAPDSLCFCLFLSVSHREMKLPLIAPTDPYPEAQLLNHRACGAVQIPLAPPILEWYAKPHPWPYLYLLPTFSPNHCSQHITKAWLNCSGTCPVTQIEEGNRTVCCTPGRNYHAAGLKDCSDDLSHTIVRSWLQGPLIFPILPSTLTRSRQKEGL